MKIENLLGKPIYGEFQKLSRFDALIVFSDRGIFDQIINTVDFMESYPGAIINNEFLVPTDVLERVADYSKVENEA